jgi:hypothetical protein
MSGNILQSSRIALSNRESIALGRSQPTTGTGIAFPETQNASSDANTLDDYQEGVFTPVIEGTSTPGTATYARQAGVYTKIGNVVNFWLDVVWSGGTGTGNIKITGLPFPSSSTVMVKSLSTISDGISMTAGYIAAANISVSTQTIGVIQIPSGGGASINIPYDAAGQFVISGSYFVD